MQPWLRRVAAAKRDASLFTSGQAAEEFKIPKTLGPGAFEVVGIPLKKPGLYIVEIESAILGKALLDPPRPMYVPAAALVTNLSVHFKQGRDASLVWVTTLDTAAPVPGAEVAVTACDGGVLWSGQTDANGIARIDAALPPAAGAGACAAGLPEGDGFQPFDPMVSGEGLFITAHTAEDMSFVHSSWNEGIEAWRFKLPVETGSGPVIVHTIFDRSLLRAGDIVHMKHLIRRNTMSGFALPPSDRLPDSVSIRHAGSNQTYELPVAWDAAGVAESQWAIPREAKLGVYSVRLVRKGGPGETPSGGEGDEEITDEIAQALLNSYVGRDFMTAIANRNMGEFIRQALFYLCVFAASTVVAVIHRYVEERLGMLWREWLTRGMFTQFLNHRMYYYLKELFDDEVGAGLAGETAEVVGLDVGQAEEVRPGLLELGGRVAVRHHAHAGGSGVADPGRGRGPCLCS